MPVFQNDCSMFRAPCTLYAYGWTNQSQIGGFLQCMKNKRLDEVSMKQPFHSGSTETKPNCCCCFPLVCDCSFVRWINGMCYVYVCAFCLLFFCYFFYTCRNHRSEKDLCCNIQKKTLLRSSQYIIAEIARLLLLQFLNVFFSLSQRCRLHGFFIVFFFCLSSIINGVCHCVYDKFVIVFCSSCYIL